MQLASLGEPHVAHLETTDLGGWESPQAGSSSWSELYAATTPQAAVRELAQACFEDLGVGWFQRDPSEDGETWRSLQRSDVRVLCQLDGVLSAGAPLLEQLEANLDDLQVPQDWFAQTLVLAHIQGSRAAQLLRETLNRLQDAEADARLACTEALAASAQPDLSALAPLGECLPAARAALFGARVLRQELTEAEALAHVSAEHPGLLAAVAAALSRWAAESPRSHQALLELLQLEDEEVLTAALASGAVARIPAAYERALGVIRVQGPAHAGAALAAVLHSRQATTQWLVDCWQQRPGPELAEAMGRHGDPELVPFLIAQLEAEQHPETCAAALTLLTGAQLYAERLQPVYEQADAPFVDDPDARVAVVAPVVDPAAWREYWSAHASHLCTVSRVRFGRPYVGSVLLAQLDAGTGSFHSRAYTQLELQALARGRAPFVWVRDWFARQARAMRQLQAWVTNSGAHLRGELRRARA